jgi:uncharacterized protein (DUF58 family)
MWWVLSALLLLLAALLLESGLLAYAMYVLLGVLLLSRWLSRSWAEGLQARRIVHKAGATEDEKALGEGLALEIGDRLIVRLIVENLGYLPIPWVLLDDALPGGLEARQPKFKVKGRRLQVGMLAGRGKLTMKYSLTCLARGYQQIGPLVLETGDLFGLHRRYRILAEPRFVLVYPRIVPLSGYDLASRRPIGDVILTHRLFEDPTRIAGVREYQTGDPLNRVHWKVTARTGQLHCKINEPSTLSGATVLLDFHRDSYPRRGEPMRSELAVTTAVSLAHAVFLLGQQIGLVCNGRDAAERIRTEGWNARPASRAEAQQTAAEQGEVRKIEPLVVPTRRGAEQLQRIREVLARVELSEVLDLPTLLVESAHRLPRDATVLAVLGAVSVEAAIALGNLRRRGMAVAVVLVCLNEDGLELAHARLITEGIRDLRHLQSEAELPDVCQQQVHRLSHYDFATPGGG